MFVYADSGAKVLDKDVAHEEDDESSAAKQSKLRRANVSLLADEDNRYSGKRISRKSLEGLSAITKGKAPGGRFKHCITRMHSSRMRTDHGSSNLGGGGGGASLSNQNHPPPTRDAFWEYSDPLPGHVRDRPTL